MIIWPGFVIAAYFILYFSSVQATTHKAPGSVTPEVAYFPSDTDFRSFWTGAFHRRQAAMAKSLMLATAAV